MPSIDPTGTTGIRRKFAAAGKQQLRFMRTAIGSAIITHDMLGLGANAKGMPRAPADRLEAFGSWLDHESKRVLVADWWQNYVKDACSAAVARVGDELAIDMPAIAPGGLAHLIVLGQEELRGIASALVQGAARSAYRHVVKMSQAPAAFRDLVACLDSMSGRILAFADTMTVTAFNDTKLELYRAHGVEQVGVDPEMIQASKQMHDAKLVGIRTAGDDRVCQRCDDLAEDSPYTLAEAIGLIPAHPRCRCAWYPWGDRRYRRDAVGGDNDA